MHIFLILLIKFCCFYFCYFKRTNPLENCPYTYHDFRGRSVKISLLVILEKFFLEFKASQAPALWPNYSGDLPIALTVSASNYSLAGWKIPCVIMHEIRHCRLVGAMMCLVRAPTLDWAWKQWPHCSITILACCNVQLLFLRRSFKCRFVEHFHSFSEKSFTRNLFIINIDYAWKVTSWKLHPSHVIAPFL